MEKVNVYEILRKRYPESEYALMKEVSNDAGFNRSRSADYIVMNLWPSRGLHLICIEQKISRTDWLKELKNPAKAESIAQYCDFFYLLTTDASIARIEEIPANWGWLNIKGGKVFTLKEAPLLKETKPLSRGFLAAMLKRAQSKDGFTLTSQIEDRIEAARLSGKEYAERNSKHIQSRLEELNKNVDEYEQATGINLRNCGFFRKPKKIGEAVKFYENGGASKIKEELLDLEKIVTGLQSKISKGLESLKELT